jgi:cell division protein FtsB
LKGLLLIPALVGVALVCAAVDDGSGIRRSYRLRSDLHVAEQRVAALQVEIDALRRQVTALEGEPFAMERAIREDLDFARPGETVVRLVPAVGPNPRFD